MTAEAKLTIGAVFDAYFDCRRTKRNSINQLRPEADLESNLVALYRQMDEFLRSKLSTHVPGYAFNTSKDRWPCADGNTYHVPAKGGS